MDDETKNTQNTNDDQVDSTKEFRERNDISVDSDVEFHPTLTFEMAKKYIPASLIESFCGKFEKPTPIQAQCWPIAASSRDMIGIAETGSGKTLAFLLPGIAKIQKSKNAKGKVKILVLSPTRELAMQSADVCNQSDCGVTSVCIGGGVSKDGQRKALRAGAQVVIATPGRLIDLVNDGSIILDHVEYLVLDEADRMLDLGFEEDIKKIIARVPSERQTLMFSATWPESIRELAHSFLRNPVRVSIGSIDLTASHSVTQIVEYIEPYQKENRLHQLLQEYHSSRTNRVLIFCLYKKEAARVEKTLKQRGWKNCQAIHGDLSQDQRNTAFKGFKDGTSPLLVATDVAARGLDIPNVEYVINYTFPLTIEDYIHRIGRTGRAGKTGTAHTLFTVQDKAKAGDLVNVLREAGVTNYPAELDKFGPSIHRKKEHKLYGAFFKDDAKPMPPATRITFDD